jgi:hypothetical protein
MYFEYRAITSPLHLRDKAIDFVDPQSDVHIEIRPRDNAEEFQQIKFEPGDCYARAFSQRELSERILKEVRETGKLPITKGAITKLHSEMTALLDRTVRVARWRFGIPQGGPSPLRGSLGFWWSLDAESWKAVDRMGTHSFAITWTRAFGPWDDAAFDFIKASATGERAEPLAHELLREAKQIHQQSPRSALVIGVAAAEVGFKMFVSQVFPQTSWLMDLPTPSLEQMIDNLQWSKLGCTVNGKTPFIPGSLKRVLKASVNRRNKLVHAGLGEVSASEVDDVIEQIRDFLYLLDVLSSPDNGWAWNLIRPDSLSEFNSDKATDISRS